MRERKNVYTLPPGDKTLEWYGKAVLEMKSRPTTDPTSWYYQGAIHGFDSRLPIWRDAPPLPPSNEQYKFWNQCQHGSWYFLPWHRMYLAYFEQIVAKTIVDLGGPSDWSLPYWNYSDMSNPKALDMPSAFTTPANTSNGLWLEDRVSDVLQARYVTLQALTVIPYTGDGTTSPLGFGGPETAFSHSGRTHGRLESLPHDMVHVMIGGAMGDPRTAALDPIFWLHHANIDRLWQVWLNEGNRFNPLKSNWLNFGFEFHNKNGKVATLTCEEVEDTTKVLDGYSYQGVPTSAPKLKRAAVNESLAMTELPMEVIGASNTSNALSSNSTVSKLSMVKAGHKRSSFMKALSGTSKPKTTFLHFENVTGKGVPPIYDVYINLPDGAEKEAHYAGSLGFFGIEEASTANEHHSGSGQHFALDISNLVEELKQKNLWNEEELDITLAPERALDDDASVNVGRMSIYAS